MKFDSKRHEKKSDFVSKAEKVFGAIKIRGDDFGFYDGMIKQKGNHDMGPKHKG